MECQARLRRRIVADSPMEGSAADPRRGRRGASRRSSSVTLEICGTGTDATIIFSHTRALYAVRSKGAARQALAHDSRVKSEKRRELIMKPRAGRGGGGVGWGGRACIIHARARLKCLYFKVTRWALILHNAAAKVASTHRAKSIRIPNFAEASMLFLAY